MADFTCAIAVRLASPTMTGRDIKTWHRAHVTTASHQIGAPEIKMIRVEAAVNRAIRNLRPTHMRCTMHKPASISWHNG
jgi:hypothetical protein